MCLVLLPGIISPEGVFDIVLVSVGCATGIGISSTADAVGIEIVVVTSQEALCMHNLCFGFNILSFHASELFNYEFLSSFHVYALSQVRDVAVAAYKLTVNRVDGCCIYVGLGYAIYGSHSIVLENHVQHSSLITTLTQEENHTERLGIGIVLSPNEAAVLEEVGNEVLVLIVCAHVAGVLVGSHYAFGRGRRTVY